MNQSMAWYALQSKPKCEWKALEVLMAKGYECFLPTHRDRKQRTGRSLQKDRPLFPSYLFCRFDPRASVGMGRVISTQYILRIVSFGNRPVAIFDHEVEALLKVVHGGLPRQPWDYIPTGTRVRIAKGPLTGIEGIRLPNTKDDTLLLSVSLLQRSVLVTIEQGAVVPATNNSYYAEEGMSRPEWAG